MPRTRDDGYWVASGTTSYHADKKRIKLVRIWDTGHVEFRPILEKVYEEIRTREQIREREASEHLDDLPESI